MRTWMVIFKKDGKVESRIMKLKTFEDVVCEIMWSSELCDADIKAIFEVAR